VTFAWEGALETMLGARTRAASPLSGGDINDAFRVELDDGRAVFVKTNARAPRTMFAAEARGLEWLREANAIRVPRVLGVGPSDAVPFLVLEYLTPARRTPNFDERLGRSLAALHRFGAPQFGLDHDNFVGRLPQSNASAPTWSDFYRDRRLLPQVKLARDAGLLSASILRSVERLVRVLDDRVGAAEPPSRLHGDFWGGNLHVDEHGEPCLIDPAAYGGHREVDLAMMRLFGGFGDRVFSAYAEAFPHTDGHDDRVPLYQLYPLLVHVNLFGGSYVASVERALRDVV
jgi:fructosamine-3-kinase